MTTPTNGRICCLELLAADTARSAEFYARAAGWELRKPAAEPGLLFYVMVDDVAATLERIVGLGGAVVQPVGADAREVTARFRAPGGNVVGLYQEPRGTSGGG